MRRKFLPVLRWKRGVDIDTVIYSRVEQHRVAPMLHSNTSIVTCLETSSSPVARRPLGRHIALTYLLWIIFSGDTYKAGSMLTTPKLLMRSRIRFERISVEFPMRYWTGPLQTSVCEYSHSDSVSRNLDRAHHKILSCVRKMVVYEKKLTPHKIFMSVKQAYEQCCKVFLPIQNAI